MKRRCIFRVQFEGSMWRVLESLEKDEAGRYEYRIMHNRRVLERFRQFTGCRAIEQCVRYALGVGVEIYWGEVL